MRGLLLFICIVVYMIPSMACAALGSSNEVVSGTAGTFKYAKDSSFRAFLHTTSKDEILFKNWSIPTKGVGIVEESIFDESEVMTIIIIFGGCAADKNNNCNVIADFTITNPRGESQVINDIQVWADRPALDADRIELGVGYIKEDFAPDYIAGDYRITAMVKDTVSGQSIDFDKTVTLKKCPDTTPSKDEMLSSSEVNSIYMNYFRQPQPEKIPLVFDALTQTPKGKRYNPVMVFYFSRVIKDNPSLIPEFLKRLEGACSGVQMVINEAIWLSGRKEGLEHLKSLSGWADIVDSNPPVILDTPLDSYSPTTLDIFWSGFFVTGDERYVKKVIDALELSGSKSRNEMLVTAAAQWSLSAIASRYPEVMKICENEMKARGGPISDKLTKVISEAKSMN